jgi:branched-chain amino acid transport system substrate-binding protein
MSKVIVRSCLQTVVFQAVVLVGLFLSGEASAQISDDVVKIGVLSDQAGPGAFASGPGAAYAARMAVRDFGGSVLGKPIVVIDADFQNKTDIAVAIARRWFDTENVDVIADLPFSSAALAVQEIARTKKKVSLIAGAAASDLTGKACSPFTLHWADDTFTLATALASGLLDEGADSWFFLAADYALGFAFQRDATAVVSKRGKVVGGVRFPVESADFASFLLQAQSSKAKVIGIASVGSTTVDIIKQSAEFGVSPAQRLAGFLVFISDIDSMGLAVAQGLTVVEGFYWDQNDESRAWAKRFFEDRKMMPTKEQAAVYASVMHYLRAVEAAGTDATESVSDQMHKMPVDFFGRKGSVRPDGRVIFDVSVYQVKSPDESKYPWDYYKELRVIPQSTAYRPIDQGGCDISRH